MPDAVGLSGSFGSGRFALVSLRCEKHHVVEARHRTMNCVAAIAAAEWVCEWARHRSYREIRLLDIDTIVEALEGLPHSRRFCAQLVRDALVTAALDARKKGLLS